MNTENERLAPCPFCGGEASVRTYETESLWSRNTATYTKVGCDECEFYFATEPGFEVEAPGLWNRRAPSAPMPGDDVVEQCDRDAAADSPHMVGLRAAIRAGKFDDNPVVQSFARHRRAALSTLTKEEPYSSERAQIVAGIEIGLRSASKALRSIADATTDAGVAASLHGAATIVSCFGPEEVLTVERGDHLSTPPPVVEGDDVRKRRPLAEPNEVGCWYENCTLPHCDCVERDAALSLPVPPGTGEVG